MARIVPSLQLAQTEPLLHLTPYTHTFKGRSRIFLHKQFFARHYSLPPRQPSVFAWLAIKFKVIKFKVILITFKAIKGAEPNYLQELISFKGNSSNGLRSNDSFLLAQPKQRTLTTLGDRTFAIAAPMLWNCLPVELRNPNISIESFKVKLKTRLFREAYR